MMSCNAHCGAPAVRSGLGDRADEPSQIAKYEKAIIELPCLQAAGDWCSNVACVSTRSTPHAQEVDSIHLFRHLAAWLQLAGGPVEQCHAQGPVSTGRQCQDEIHLTRSSHVWLFNCS